MREDRHQLWQLHVEFVPPTRSRRVHRLRHSRTSVRERDTGKNDSHRALHRQRLRLRHPSMPHGLERHRPRDIPSERRACAHRRSQLWHGLRSRGRFVWVAFGHLRRKPGHVGRQCAVELRGRRIGSWHRVVGAWMSSTYLEAHTPSRPTAANLPYPINLLYDGKPLVLRTIDNTDESRKYDSFNGVTTIWFEPHKQR